MGGSYAAHPEDLDVRDASFARPDVTTFCRLGELGLDVLGLRPGRLVGTDSDPRSSGAMSIDEASHDPAHPDDPCACASSRWFCGIAAPSRAGP